MTKESDDVEEYFLDLKDLKTGVVLFLFGVVIYFFIFFQIYLDFTVNGGVRKFWVFGGYADFVLLLLGVVFVANSFKRKEVMDVNESLRRLQDALAQGLITNEEYEEKRKEILEKI